MRDEFGRSTWSAPRLSSHLLRLVRSDEGLPKLDVWSSPIRLAQYELPFRTALEQIDQGDRILDWGCGNGHFSFFLGSHGFPVTGYSMLDQPGVTRQNDSFRFVSGSKANPVSVPFGDASFDVALSVGVLEHVHETGGDQVSSLVEIHRVLAPGGRFLLFHLPNRWSWIEAAARVHRRIFKTHRYVHTRRFSRAEIEAMAANNDFLIEKMVRYNMLPRNSIPAFSVNERIDAFAALSFEIVDHLLLRLIPVLAQNYCVVLVKPVDSASVVQPLRHNGEADECEQKQEDPTLPKDVNETRRHDGKACKLSGQSPRPPT